MDKKRLEELLIKALEWTSNCSEQMTKDMISAIGITNNELDEIGYEQQKPFDWRERYG